MPAPRSWTIGSAAECDLLVDRPTVSARHCRLTRDAEGYALEDLGSSNGTCVNGRRITSSVRVRPQDRITLGADVPLPWPDDAWPSGRGSSGSGATPAMTS
jgi:pSer/pThr/pTyr-binding forkhead associated (FHA) protein